MSELDILKQLDALAAVTASFTLSAAAVISQQRRDLEQAATDISNLAERVSVLEDRYDDNWYARHDVARELDLRHPFAPASGEERPPEVEP